MTTIEMSGENVSASCFLHSLPDAPARVAIVRASRIGDFLCATPALRALRLALPHAHFAWIGLPMVRELVERSPHIDRFIPFPGFPGMADQFFNPHVAIRFFGQAQAMHFDLAVQLHGSGVYSNTFTLLLGARATVGFVRPGEPKGRLDAAVPLPEDGHERHRLLALPNALGAPVAGDLPEFHVRPADEQEAMQLLSGLEPPLIAIHPDGREPDKRWPLHRFLDAARILVRDAGSVVILGENRDGYPLDNAGMRDLRGLTSLGGLGAVIARLSVLITNDSGPAHIAYALGTPSVTLFGPTDPRQWGPTDCGRHRIVVARRMTDIGVDEVVSAARALDPVPV